LIGGDIWFKRFIGCGKNEDALAEKMIEKLSDMQSYQNKNEDTLIFQHPLKTFFMYLQPNFLIASVKFHPLFSLKFSEFPHH
jgi:hypothetical protein